MPIPTEIPVPDKFYLPALKIEADLGKVRFVSNTSYFHRDETTGYEGTLYNLSYYQTIGWPDSGYGLSADHLPADRHRRRAFAAGTYELPLAGDGPKPAAQRHPGDSFRVERSHEPLHLDRGRLLAAHA